MDQFKQFEDSLNQVRQSFNTMVNQINQQLTSLETLSKNMKTRPEQQYTGYGSQSQTYNQSQYSGYNSQYQPRYNQNQNLPGYQSTNNRLNPSGEYQNNQYNSQNNSPSQYNRNNINPISGLSEDKPTASQQAGVNRYGAEYSSENDRGQ